MHQVARHLSISPMVPDNHTTTQDDQLKIIVDTRLFTTCTKHPSESTHLS